MRATRPGAGGRTSLPDGSGGTGDIESACRRGIWKAQWIVSYMHRSRRGEKPVYEGVRKKRGGRGDINAQDHSLEKGERRPSGLGPQERSHMKRPIHEMTITEGPCPGCLLPHRLVYRSF